MQLHSNNGSETDSYYVESGSDSGFVVSTEIPIESSEPASDYRNVDSFYSEPVEDALHKGP